MGRTQHIMYPRDSHLCDIKSHVVADGNVDTSASTFRCKVKCFLLCRNVSLAAILYYLSHVLRLVRWGDLFQRHSFPGVISLFAYWNPRKKKRICVRWSGYFDIAMYYNKDWAEKLNKKPTKHCCLNTMAMKLQRNNKVTLYGDLVSLKVVQSRSLEKVQTWKWPRHNIAGLN